MTDENRNDETTAQGERIVYRDKPKKPFYKRAIFWLPVILLLFIIAAAGGSDTNQSTRNNSSTAPKSENRSTESTKWDGNAVFDNIQTGMTKAEAERVIGKEPSNCSQMEDATFGKYESCSYGNPFTDKVTITVGYGNDGKVTTKNKFTN